MISSNIENGITDILLPNVSPSSGSDLNLTENEHQLNDMELTHPVVDVTSDQQEKLMCEKHINLELTHFCRKCEVPVCGSCRTSTTHKGHRTKRIGVAVSERKSKLLTEISLENDKYKELLGKLALVEDEKASVRSSCDEVVARIRQRCAYMKSILDTAANALVKEVYLKKKDCVQQYTACQREMQKDLKDTECILDFMHFLSETQDTKCFLEGFNELEPRSHPEKKIPQIWKEYVSFDHGNLSAKELQERFGTVSFISATDGGAFTFENKKQHRRLSCSTKRSFKCVRRKHVESDDEEQDDGPINSITKYQDKLLVSCGLSSRQIAIVDKMGKTIKTMRLNIKVKDITAFENGDLLVSIFHDKAIKRVSQSRDITDIVNVPFHPTGLDSTKDGGFLVCMCDSYSTSVSSESRRLVVKYNKYAQEVCTYEYNDGEKLFTRPYRVAENANGDVCVIDKTSMGTGQVVILDQHGNVQGTYNGNMHFTDKNSNPNITSEFSPTDIACDANGHIFITEPDSHKIHMLNSDCSYLGHILTSESDFICPKCITTDEHNQIWVGNEYGEIKMFTCDWQ